ncbi:hypothetical protein BKI52_00385 [marine bacterium AO1-C]|nr:hypothetical protein BKI52_00385 [marine bacterium AO1-C]
MKTLPKLLFILCLIAIPIVQSYAQAPAMRMVTKNANGTEEYLYYHPQGNYYVYASSTRPKRIKLINVRENMINGQKTKVVKFPGSNALYKLVIGGSNLTCINPNGSQQAFVLEEKLASKGKNGLIEYLYIPGPGVFYYNNNRNKRRVELKIVGGSQSAPMVQFPGSSKRYKLTYLMNGNIMCNNPDGNTQYFTKDY